MTLSRARWSLLASVFVLAAVYFITGWLGLLLAIPPGYATAVWPASGAALAALLLYGYRLWPGVWLGSFMVNIAVSFDGSSSQTILKSLTIATSVGIGASLQALLGAYLINRFMNVKSGLVHSREVMGFLGLGGPVSCLLSATWGVTTLWLLNLISNTEYPFSWINWWIGDAIGVIVFLPIVYTFFGRPAEIWQWRKKPVAIPLILATAAVIAFFIVASEAEQKRIETEFAQRVKIVADSLEKKWISYIDVLHSVHGLILSTGDLNGYVFHSFVRHSLSRTQGIQALSWNPQVYQHQRDAFETKMRENGYVDFKITERSDAGDLIKAGSRSRYVVVQYIEPFRGNEKAQGYDVYSNPIRQKAMDVARDSGKLAATARIDLVQGTRSQAGILVLLPVYHTDIVLDRIEDRRNNLHGYVVGVFRMGDVLSAAMEGLKIEYSTTYLIDATAAEQDEVLTAFRVSDQGIGELLPLNEAIPVENKLSWSSEIAIGNRNWRLLVTPTSKYFSENRSWAAWWVLAGGLILTGLLGSFLLIITGREILEGKRIKELASLNEELNNEVTKRHEIENSLREANECLNELATVDHLTGVYNRRYIQECAKRIDAEMHRYDQHYSIILFDIDNFKLVNDRFGHDVGDLALREIARKIENQLRETDCLGRWGGEEFLIIAKQTSLNECTDFAQRLRLAICEKPLEQVGIVSISIGVASNDGTLTLEETIKQADQGLYLAKRNGRNCVAYI
ncbi:MAG: diguanylate cyclase [Candidatus Thiodiazotropha sp. (ex Dulcina madagascariensis)]|nr:diguanylate cyclase [Candidatus Thiodiazotropha sp. (ex Dulcina madagascariensis)]MCU7925347.1 diguanylate cyclase [Candidatus Thiodiazotropha sp. (ex Dulcina madagascariensis)]